MEDYLIKASAYADTVRIYVAQTTNTIETARKIHDFWPAAAAAFGRTLTTTAIMGTMLKDDQTITIQIDGKGPIGKIITIANTRGECRGVATNPHVHMSYENGKLAVGKVVGNHGFIHVTKDLKLKNIFTSSAELQTGEIADDFTYYFAKSEQVPSSVGLGVLVDTDNSVKAAGGFIIQVMPGVSEQTIDTIETVIRSTPSVTELIDKGLIPEDILSLFVKDDCRIIDKVAISYSCDCSRERFAKGLISLGSIELDEMIASGEKIEIQCQFCSKIYRFSIDDLLEMKKSMANPNNEKERS